MSDPTGLTPSGGIDPVLKLLFCGTIFLILLLVAISKWSPNDGQTFQVISGIATGFAGAFMTRIMPSKDKDKGDSAK